MKHFSKITDHTGEADYLLNAESAGLAIEILAECASIHEYEVRNLVLRAYERLGKTSHPMYKTMNGAVEMGRKSGAMKTAKKKISSAANGSERPTWQINGPAGISRGQSKEAAWDRYVNLSEKKGFRHPGHIPGNVRSDSHFQGENLTIAIRYGHGCVQAKYIGASPTPYCQEDGQ